MMKAEQDIFLLGSQSNYENEDEQEQGSSEQDDNSSYMNRVRTRKGKWTEEEETYTMKLIEAFIAGVLPLAAGTTLRSFLSDKLCCDPMRITKKFAGSNGIGKQIFMPTSIERESFPQGRTAVEIVLDELERRFFQKIEHSLSSRHQQEFPSSASTTIASTTVVKKKKKKQMCSASDSDIVPELRIKGYHVPVPSHKHREVLLTYSDVIHLIYDEANTSALSMDKTSSASSETLTKTNPLASGASSSKSHNKAGEKEKTYINTSYRVAGFEHLAENEALVESELKHNLKRKSKTAAPCNDAAAVKRKQSTAVRAASLGSANASSAVDLQASSLLLDFFKSAQSKGSADECEGKRRGLSVDSDDTFSAVVKESRDSKEESSNGIAEEEMPAM